MRTDGGVGTTIYTKTSGAGTNTGWSAIAGTGTITGTGVANQVTFFTASTVLGGDAGMTYTAASDLLTLGALKITAGGLNYFQINDTLHNTAVGRNAGTSMASPAAENTALGWNALGANVAGFRNVAVGHNALSQNLTNYNTAVGYEALAIATTADSNTGIGVNALAWTVTGSRNTGVGHDALEYTTSSDNTGIGYRALVLQTSGSQNTAVGQGAMYENLTGDNNTAVGLQALNLGTNADGNTAVGYKSQYTNQANYNSSLGFQALYNNSTGDTQVAVGYSALFSHATGAFNVAVGGSALYSNVAGARNTAIGPLALYSNLGNNNVALGHYAGAYETGDNAFYVDSLNRTTTAGDKAGALLYGVFNATPSLQTLQINASLSLPTTSGAPLTASAAVTGGQIMTLRNTTANAASYTQLYLGNDLSAVRGYLFVGSSTFTTTGYLAADGVTVGSAGDGGLSIVAGAATGTTRFYQGGPPILRGTMNASGVFDWLGASTIGGTLGVTGNASVADLAVNGGDVTSTSTTGLTLAPDYHLIVNPTRPAVRPAVDLQTDLGSKFFQWRAAYIGELVVQNLVQLDTAVTMDGSLMVIKSAVMVSPLAAADTTIRLSANHFVSGHRGYIRRDGKLEYIAFTSGPTAINRVANPSIELATTGYVSDQATTITRSATYQYKGNYALKTVFAGVHNVYRAVAGEIVASTSQTFSVFVRRADGGAIVPSSSRYTLYLDSTDGPLTATGVEFVGLGWYRLWLTRNPGVLGDAVVGVMDIPGTETDHYFDAWQSELGALTPYYDNSASYTVTRDLDGSGANDWPAGTVVANTGTTGSGWVSIDAVQTMLGSGAGPVQVMWQRQSATYNDIAPCAAMGNLDTLYGYSGDTFGMAGGCYKDSSNYFTVEPTNGLRFFSRTGGASTLMAQLSSTTWTLGNTSTEHVAISSTSVALKDGATTRISIDSTNGMVINDSAGAAVITLNASAGAEITKKLTMPGANSAIAIGATPPTTATDGDGIWIDRTGFYALDGSVEQVIIDAATGKLTAGNVTLDVNGVSIAPAVSASPLDARAYKFPTQWGTDVDLGMYALDYDASGADRIHLLLVADASLDAAVESAIVTVGATISGPTGSTITFTAATTTADLSGHLTITGRVTLADDQWIGLGSAAGRIEFDNQTTDEINILDAVVGVGTSLPTERVDVVGNIRVRTANAVKLYNAADSNWGTIKGASNEGSGYGEVLIQGGGGSAGILVNNGGRVGLKCVLPDHDLEIGGTGAGCNTGTGSYMDAGATAFTANSSWALKADITPVHVPDILARMRLVQPSAWTWKDSGAPGFGLIAEDFYPVLRRGDGQHVSGQDVMMATWLGVQALDTVTQQQAAEIAALKARIAQLERGRP